MTLFYILFIGILGACFGSFFNVCIYRIPQKKSIAFPASHCPACSEPIPGWLNIPIIGYLLSLGKCRKCGSNIHWHYPLVEFVTPLLFILLYLKFGFTLPFFQYTILFSAGIIIFFIDAFHQIIPDVLSLPLIPLGLIFSLHPATKINIVNSIAATVAGFLFFYLLALGYWKLRGKMGLGGGDIKLIAGIGAFLGVLGLLFVVLISAILALLTILISRHDLQKTFSFGPFMILAVTVFVLFGHNLVQFYLSLF